MKKMSEVYGPQKGKCLSQWHPKESREKQRGRKLTQRNVCRRLSKPKERYN
jgi:hypothetical protein